MARDAGPSTLLLRLPARAADPARYSIALQASLSFVWSVRGRLLRIAHAPLAELAPQLADAQRVILLLAASDVTLMRVPVPPLPAARLQAALPALVEDHVIGDPADCAIAAGPEVDGQRVLAVVDREWLQRWVQAVRQQGARRIVALPMQLCLPLPAGQVGAALLEWPSGRELALRFSADEGIGLPVVVDDDAQLPDAVASLLTTLAPARAVQLSLPASLTQSFRDWLLNHPDSGIVAVEENWAVWAEGATQIPLDLVSGIAGAHASPIDWRRWRWPLALAVACVLVNGFALNADWWRLRSEGARLNDAMAALFRRSFPNEPLMRDPLAQMQQRLAVNRQAAGEFAPGDFLALSAALGEAWAEAGNDLRAIASLEYRDGLLELTLKPGARLSPETMQTALLARRLQATVSPADPQRWQIRSR
jgi:general secretion pathway protein L